MLRIIRRSHREKKSKIRSGSGPWLYLNRLFQTHQTPKKWHYLTLVTLKNDLGCPTVSIILWMRKDVPFTSSVCKCLAGPAGSWSIGFIGRCSRLKLEFKSLVPTHLNIAKRCIYIYIYYMYKYIYIYIYSTVIRCSPKNGSRFPSELHSRFSYHPGLQQLQLLWLTRAWNGVPMDSDKPIWLWLSILYQTCNPRHS